MELELGSPYEDEIWDEMGADDVFVDLPEIASPPALNEVVHLEPGYAGILMLSTVDGVAEVHGFNPAEGDRFFISVDSLPDQDLSRVSYHGGTLFLDATAVAVFAGAPALNLDEVLIQHVP